MAGKKKKARSNQPGTKRKREVTFDAESRQEYLTGFSERKRQRRAFGLAMQKVKDRNAKLESRAETRKAEREQIEEAEKQKDEMLENYLRESGLIELKLNHALPKNNDEIEQVEEYQDQETRNQWGGEVTVSISTKIPGETEEGTESNKKRPSKEARTDIVQEMHGNVEKYLAELKGRMPGKRRKNEQKRKNQRGGQHGASSMKGMAQGADLKLVKKFLAKSKAKKVKEGRKKKS